MKATPFGRFLRTIRVKNSQVLKDMADVFGCSSAHLSSVELGKKKLSEKHISLLIKHYGLSESEVFEMKSLIEVSVPRIDVEMKGMTDQQREAAVLFARNLKNKSPEEIEKFKQWWEN